MAVAIAVTVVADVTLVVAITVAVTDVAGAAVACQ